MANFKRKALMIGISNYPNHPLKYTTRDATAMAHCLSHHYDGRPNFDCHLLCSEGNYPLSRQLILEKIRELFKQECEIAALYFSGHAAVRDGFPFIATPENPDLSDGISFDRIMSIVQQSPAREKLIILDTCHSGHMGISSLLKGTTALLPLGTTIISSSRINEESIEVSGHGQFTKAILDALGGWASDLLGQVTAPSVYDYLSKSMSGWKQHPTFRTNVNRLTMLRECKPQFTFKEIHTLTELFEDDEQALPLDKEFEPYFKGDNKEKQSLYILLQRYHRTGLIIPDDNSLSLFECVRDEKSVVLTNLGKMYYHIAVQYRPFSLKAHRN